MIETQEETETATERYREEGKRSSDVSGQGK